MPAFSFDTTAAKAPSVHVTKLVKSRLRCLRTREVCTDTLLKQSYTPYSFQASQHYKRPPSWEPATFSQRPHLLAHPVTLLKQCCSCPVTSLLLHILVCLNSTSLHSVLTGLRLSALFTLMARHTYLSEEKQREHLHLAWTPQKR